MQRKYIIGIPIFAASVFFILATFVLVFNLVNHPLDSAADKGVGSWNELLVLVSIPRLLYAIVFALVVSIAFQLVFAKRIILNKQFVLGSVSVILIFFLLIFPSKIFSINVPEPPDTADSEYRYDRAGSGPLPSDEAFVSFRTNADPKEIVEFYQERGIFRQGEINVFYSSDRTRVNINGDGFLLQWRTRALSYASIDVERGIVQFSAY